MEQEKACAAAPVQAVVMPHPRLRRDYVGKRVRTVCMLGNGAGIMPVGSLARIVHWSPKGGTLFFDACPHCGMRLKMTMVSARSFEFLQE